MTTSLDYLRQIEDALKQAVSVIQSLQAENERLREALQVIARLEATGAAHQTFARAALAKETT